MSVGFDMSGPPRSNGPQIGDAELLSLLNSLFGPGFANSVVLARGSQDDDTPVSGAAPEVDEPQMDFATMLAQLGALTDKVFGEQLKGATELIKLSTEQRKSLNELSLQKLKEAVASLDEANGLQRKNNILGIVRAAFGVIGSALALAASIFLTPLTGPAAVACGIAAGAGLMLALLDLVNSVARQQGVETTMADGTTKPIDISIGGMVNAITEEIDEAFPDFFSSDEEKNKWNMAWGMTTTLLLMVSMMAATGYGCWQVGKLADAAADGCKTALEQLGKCNQRVDNLVRITDASSDVCQGATAGGQGGLDWMIAEAQLTVAQGQASSQFYERLSTLCAADSERFSALAVRCIEGYSGNREAMARILTLYAQPHPALAVA